MLARGLSAECKMLKKRAFSPFSFLKLLYAQFWIFIYQNVSQLTDSDLVNETVFILSRKNFKIFFPSNPNT